MTVLDRTRALEGVQFRHVVMPVDFSPLSWRVHPLARTVAHRFDADLLPLHVDTASPWRELDDDARLRLTTAPFGRRLQVNVVATRDAADGIVHFARRHAPTLIALSTHGHTGIGELAFGSVFEQVMRTVDDPVLTVGPDFDVGRHSVLSRIVACLDESPASLVVVPDALAWAHALDVPLELMTVLPGRPVAAIGAELSAAAGVENLARDLAQAHERISSLVLHGGRPGFEIVRYAESVPGTLLVMSTHARPALTRAVTGSVVMHVARHTTTGLLLRRRPAQPTH